MNTAIVPIIKSKTGNSSDKNNYRPFVLVTACLNFFELCLLEIIELIHMITNSVLKNIIRQTCVYLR